jgi:hypothetical protein
MGLFRCTARNRYAPELSLLSMWTWYFCNSAFGSSAHVLTAMSSASSDADALRCLDRRSQERRFQAAVLYSAYPFIVVSQLSALAPEDINYLDIKQCLSVPARPLLDEFMQQYFTYFHPSFPLINEALFWTMYRGQRSALTTLEARMPLLVFQSMLFLACPYVSACTLERLGFADTQAAQKAFYERVKTLYYMDTELSKLHQAQAALALSFRQAPTEKPATRTSNMWLCIAVENAKALNAHHCHALSHPSRTAEDFPASTYNKASLRRLWACCIVRDGALAVTLRQNCRITSEDLGTEPRSILSQEDLSIEVGRSEVQSPASKERTIATFLRLIELCGHIHRISSLVYPYDREPNVRYLAHPDEISRLQDARSTLAGWYASTMLLDQGPSLKGDAQTASVDGRVAALALHSLYIQYQ